MSLYPQRQEALPSTSRIKLEGVDGKVDGKKVLGACFLFTLVLIPVSLGYVFLMQSMSRSTAALVGGGLMASTALGIVIGIGHILKKMSKLRFLIEISETELQLLAPSGDRLASTSSGTLLFMRVNYTRPAYSRRGSARLRPGWLMRHPGGEHLVGTLFPELPWEGLAHDPRLPEFELLQPQFKLLNESLRRTDDDRPGAP